MIVTEGQREAKEQQASESEVRAKYHEEEGQLLLLNCKRGAILAAVFSLAGFLLDYLIFWNPEQWYILTSIVGLRLVAVGVLVFLFYLLHRTENWFRIRLMAHAIALVPIVALHWVLVVIEDAASPYYAGLNLIMVAAVLLLRWRLADAVANALFCLGGYVAVALGLGATVEQILTSFFFLFVTSVFACIGAYMLNKLRYAEFRNNYQLNVKNVALAEALEELHENEVRLLQAEKLSSLGRMSAGIVHEVNNPLNYAVTALHMLQAYADDMPESEREDYRETVGDAEEGVGRVIKIVSDLRAFTKGEINMGQEVNLAGVLESARRLVSDDLSGIEFVVEVPEDLKVLGNDNQLCQVFMNFIQNASQAVVKTKDHGKEPEIRVRGERRPDGEILLVIRDNGCGIEVDDLEVIFEPFFTKRQVGEGMGLGLSICHSILKAHGARVEVASEPDHFTEFSLYFPSLNHSEDRRLEAEALDESDPQGAATPP